MPKMQWVGEGCGKTPYGQGGEREFLKEVMEYNLSVSEMPLDEYIGVEHNWCKC